ncbi:MAG: hypothetical protein ACQES1_04330 [Bacteroidota bacterium]
MKNIVTLCLILIVVSGFSQAEKGQSRLGVRMGILQGVSFQYYFNDNLALESIGAVYRWDPAFFIFAQYHTLDITSDEQLRLVSCQVKYDG